MSAEHRRPLVAFVVVSVVCAVMLGHAIRSDALVGLFGHRERPVPAAARNDATATVRDTTPGVAPRPTPTALRGPSAEPVAQTPIPVAPTPTPTPTPTKVEDTGGQPVAVSARGAARDAAKEARDALKSADKALAVAVKTSDQAAKEAEKALEVAARAAAKDAKHDLVPTSTATAVPAP